MTAIPTMADAAVESRRRVLVTGGAGFIGSHVVEALLGEDIPVTVLDDLSTGDLANLPDDARLRFVHGDVTDHATTRDALTGCSRVVHLAAIASVQRSVEDPVGTHRVNYEATLQLLDLAHRYGVRRFVYASSAAVYGDEQTPPVVEAGEVNPKTPYAIDKLMGEKALAFFRREHGLSGVALRFFNVYGPRQRPDSPYSGVISLFVRRSLRGDPLLVHGDGGQTRDFVFVADVVRVVVEMTRRATPPVADVLNVGRGREVSVHQMIDAIEATLGYPVERLEAPSRPGDVRHSRADVGRLRCELDWVPETPLELGLRRCVEHEQARAPRPRRCAGVPGKAAIVD